MLHGFMGTGPSHFSGQISFFQDNYETIVMDLPGHGTSKVEANEDYFDQALDWVIEQIKEKGEGYILGLSLGASLAIHVALREPSLLKGIVLTGYSPFIPDHFKSVMETQYHYFTNIEQNDPNTANQLKELHGDKWYDTLKKVLYSQTYHYPTVSDETLRELKVPMLILNGSNDMHEVDAVQYIKEKNKNINIGLIPNAGHTANMDRPEVYNMMVKEFLKRSR